MAEAKSFVLYHIQQNMIPVNIRRSDIDTVSTSFRRRGICQCFRNQRDMEKGHLAIEIVLIDIFLEHIEISGYEPSVTIC